MGTHVRNAAFALFGKIVAHTARRFTQYDAATDRIDRSLPNTADLFEIANGDVPELDAFKDQFSICIFLKDDKQELGGRQVVVELRLFPFRLLAQLDKVKRRERHTLLDRSVATDTDRFGNDARFFEFVRLRDPAMDAEHLAKEDIVEVFRRLLYFKELLQFALRLAVIGREPFDQMLFKGGMDECAPIFDDAFIFFDAEDIFPQDLRHIGRLERICTLLCKNIGKRLLSDAGSICALRAGSQIQRIAFGDLVRATIPHLLHDRLPVVFDDHQIFFRKTEQDCLIDTKIALGNIFAVLVGHQQHRIAFVPKRTRLKGAVVFLHVVDDIAH